MTANTDPGGQPGGAAPEPNPAGNAGDPPAPGGEGMPPGAIFTQEQVNTLLRSERAKAAARFSDYDVVKARVAELESAGKTELERMQAKLEEANTRSEQATGRANRMLVQAAVTSAAVRAGAVDPDIVVALVADGLKVGKDGEVEGDVNKLVTEILDKRPFLKANGTRPGTADGGSHGRPVLPGTPSNRMDDILRGTNR